MCGKKPLFSTDNKSYDGGCEGTDETYVRCVERSGRLTDQTHVGGDEISTGGLRVVVAERSYRFLETAWSRNEVLVLLSLRPFEKLVPTVDLFRLLLNILAFVLGQPDLHSFNRPNRKSRKIVFSSMCQSCTRFVRSFEVVNVSILMADYRYGGWRVD